MQRREFLKTTTSAAAGLLTLSAAPHGTAAAAATSPTPRPLWRGFNLLEFFSGRGAAQPFRESDFEIMADWGFNFARIPMSYWHLKSGARKIGVTMITIKIIAVSAENCRSWKCLKKRSAGAIS